MLFREQLGVLLHSDPTELTRNMVSLQHGALHLFSATQLSTHDKKQCDGGISGVHEITV